MREAACLTADQSNRQATTAANRGRDRMIIHCPAPNDKKNIKGDMRNVEYA